MSQSNVCLRILRLVDQGVYTMNATLKDYRVGDLRIENEKFGVR